MGTEPAAEQHYSFLEDAAEALPEAETGETAESDAEPEAETGSSVLTETEAAENGSASEFISTADDAEAVDAEVTDAAEAPNTAEAVTLLDSTEDAVETDAVPEDELDDAEERSLSESAVVRTGTGRHHSIFDSVQVLSDAELAEIEEEERRFRESLTGLPPRKRKPDISENTEAAEPENTESKNTEAANAGGPES